jgi:hypothetical protein
MGTGPLYRLYCKAGDGWLCLAYVAGGAFPRLRPALGLDELPDPTQKRPALRCERIPMRMGIQWAQLKIRGSFI